MKSPTKRTPYRELLEEPARLTADKCRGAGSWRVARRRVHADWSSICWGRRIPETPYTWNLFRRMVREKLGLCPTRPRQPRLPF